MFKYLAIAVFSILFAGCSASPVFVYDDLDAFARAQRAVADGAEPVVAMRDYLAAASPAMPFFAERYGVTAESMAQAVARRPRHYARVGRLDGALRAFEPEIRTAIRRLNELAPGHDAPPVYYLVANLTAGGTPTELRPPVDGNEYGLAVAVESLAMSDDTDMTEFTGRYGGGYLEDIPYVVVHETVHVFQVQTQGIDNYRSIYRPGPNNTYLALAVREGCADYLTYLVTGKRRVGEQHAYGLAHEAELWDRFREVMDKPASFGDGWFGALDPATPDWPPQIGYWLGMRMCEAHHADSIDPDAAVRDLLSAYMADDVRRIARSYIARQR